MLLTSHLLFDLSLGNAIGFSPEDTMSTSAAAAAAAAVLQQQMQQEEELQQERELMLAAAAAASNHFLAANTTSAASAVSAAAAAAGDQNVLPNAMGGADDLRLVQKSKVVKVKMSTSGPSVECPSSASAASKARMDRKSHAIGLLASRILSRLPDTVDPASNESWEVRTEHLPFHNLVLAVTDGSVHRFAWTT